MATWKTLSRPVQLEIAKRKGSRFIAAAWPLLQDNGKASSLVQQCIAIQRSKFPAATHHCYAYTTRDGHEVCSDDGELHGTAGRPILTSLQQAQLLDVCVVVTRIFGGVKLGSGGLIRAYRAAAQNVIEQAAIVDMVPTRLLRIETTFLFLGVVQRACDRFSAELLSQEYAENVAFTVRVPAHKSDHFIGFIRTNSAGRVQVKETTAEYLTWTRQ